MTMNPTLRVRFDPSEVGAALANASDEEQAAAVNAFFTELVHACPSHFAAQTQIAYITDRLNAQARDVLELAEEVRPK